MEKRHKRSNKPAPINSSRYQGDIVEEVVAEMHKNPGIYVERNVYLPTIDQSGRRREIDILLSGTIAGYPIQMAIECKNEKKPVGVEEIDEFIGKLQDVGIPSSMGIFVSRSGYKKGVADRIKQAGIKPLTLNELTNIEESLFKIVQSIVFLLLSIEKITIINNIPDEATNSGDLLFFRDKDGQIVGGIPDIIWNKWINGELPFDLGVHELELNLPEGWNQVVNNKVAEVKGINILFSVKAQVISIDSKFQQHMLVNPISSTIEKFQINASFDPLEGKYKLITLNSEDELSRYIADMKSIVSLVTRNPLPRIQYFNIYWPPSEKVVNKLHELYKESIKNNKQFDLSNKSILDLEGSDLNAIFDPIWKEHPASKKKSAISENTPNN